jgi:hypothetical protein
MTVTEAFAGSSTIGATEWSLTTNTSFTPDADTTDGVFELWFDCSALARADRYTVKAYEKVQSSGTQRVVWAADIFNQQTDPMMVLPPLLLMHGWDFTLKKVAGTDRAITWGIKALGGVPTEFATGNPTVGATEYFLASASTSKTKQTSAGIYQLFLDINAVVKGDRYEVRVTEEARAADTVERVAFRAELLDDKVAGAYVLPALALLNGWEFSIIKIAGTDRAIPYSIRKLA